MFLESQQKSIESSAKSAEGSGNLEVATTSKVNSLSNWLLETSGCRFPIAAVDERVECYYLVVFVNNNNNNGELVENMLANNFQFDINDVRGDDTNSSVIYCLRKKLLSN